MNFIFFYNHRHQCSFFFDLSWHKQHMSVFLDFDLNPILPYFSFPIVPHNYRSLTTNPLSLLELNRSTKVLFLFDQDISNSLSSRPLLFQFLSLDGWFEMSHFNPFGRILFFYHPAIFFSDLLVKGLFERKRTVFWVTIPFLNTSYFVFKVLVM